MNSNCFHDRIREFSFKSGEVIKMCPDCSTFDHKRRDILRSGRVEVPKAQEQIHWGLLVEKAGLNVTNDGLDSWLTYAGDNAGAQKASEESGYSLVSDLFGKLQDVIIKRSALSRRKPTLLDDQEWVDRQKPFPHSRTMPRKFISYCVACVEVVVDSAQKRVRTTKGVYQPIEHDCGLRVYDLHNNLLEVRAI